mmetsp:Transcript_11230/g.17647  ORF Transcript_11230/g.17647 Transcript_11230/m.17647 type:complete len:191 (-) Transcript_11230:1194-1766(-)
MNASKFVVILATSTAALVALSLVISNSPSKAVTLLDVDAPTSLDRDHREWYSVGAERDDGHRHLTTSGLIKNSWPLGKRLKTQQEIDFLEQHPEYKEPEFPEAPVFRVVPREGSMQLADVDGPGSVDEPKSKWYDDGFMRDDQYARIPMLPRTVVQNFPNQYPDPATFRMAAAQQQLAALTSRPVFFERA